MAVIVRIVSADGKKIVSRSLHEVPKNLKVPAGATVEVIDEASGRKLPVAQHQMAEAAPVQSETTATTHDHADDIVIEFEEADSWDTAETALKQIAGETIDGFSEASELVLANLALADANTTEFDTQSGLFGDGGSNVLLYGALGLTALAGGIVLLSDDDDDDNGGTGGDGDGDGGQPDVLAPDAPTGLDLAASDDDGAADDDNITTISSGLTISGTAEGGSSVELFDGSISLGTATADSAGSFSIDVALGTATHEITAKATDAAGNTSSASEALTITVVAPAVPSSALNASIDGNGDVVTLYFDEAIDPATLPSASVFSVTQNGAQTINDVEVTGNRIVLTLSAPLAADGAVAVSLNGAGLTDTAGNPVSGFTDLPVTNRLDLVQSGAINFGQSSGIALDGAEIAAFDPLSDRIFITGSDGVQVVQLGADLSMTLLGTISVGTNNITSVAVSNGIVAVAVVADDKTQSGSVFFLDADGAISSASVLGNIEVGSLPDMVTFTPDGTKVLVANEAELTEDGADPESSVSIIDISGGVANATVQTAGFEAFNSQIDTLKAAGVRLFAGEAGFENTTVAQDLEPEYIAVSADGTTALITLQENNAVAILDIASATIIDIQPLGLKSFKGLLADFSDRDSAEGDNAINLTTGNPVFGQFMPDSIASFTGGDGQTYYVIANEGDDRDDFLPGFLDGFEESTRVKDLTLDASAFPNAAALQEDDVLGRLGVSQAPGNDGDLDGDGDVDQLLAYGARSFSILDAEGNIVFDSGSHIEQFAALGGLYDEDSNTGLFDDGRSDNKGPEPEGITTGVFGDSVLAFVSLERGGGGIMVYDVTDPTHVEFVQYVRNANDISPEGLTYVKPEDSPNGQALLIVASEESGTITAFEITQPGTYTLQLLHFADGEAGLLASSTAPNLAALADAFEDDYVNSITLAGGDNFLPGPFLAGGADPSINDVLPNGDTQGRVDIAIHNAIGVQASTIGNHEFDLGSRGLRDVIGADGDYAGTLFPYLSANLDFSGDGDLDRFFVETLSNGTLERASDLSNAIVPSAVLEENGELIGVVGATTQLIEQISSPSGTEVKGFPTGPGANGEMDDMALLASQIQPYIDDLIAQGVNKIVVMAHLQLIENEQELASLLTGVDIIVAAGSNTRLGDADDVAVAFPGHAANFADTYPIVTTGADGKTTVIVNTDNEYTYLGRLVVEFDANGEIITESLSEFVSVNGAYAATDQNVAAAFGTSVDNLGSTAFAEGTRGAQVLQLTNAVQQVIDVKSSNVFGFSNVYLEGARASVRTQETNLGNITADANADAARDALGLTDADVVVGLKNGGGIRSQIGTVSGTGDNVVFGPNPGGGVSQLDIENSLRFDNALMVFDTTPQGLLNILNNPAATTPNNGGFFQLGGVQVSYDPDAPEGARIQDIVLVDGNGNKVAAIADDGVIVAGAPSTITVVALNFTANGGDGYMVKDNATNFRFLLDDGTVSAPVDPADSFLDIVPANVLGEQQAFAEYLAENFGTAGTAFDIAETDQSGDLRIQNQSAREDTVLFDTPGFMVSEAAALSESETQMTGSPLGFPDTDMPTLAIVDVQVFG